ncbi:hypothetical protein [Galactobacter sp.]|uniref:hypothetical protein n=1 Tax=Galactobacter sp. TaxID=2676125 RepID=UPI0025BF91BB|nr:hypothetical protein [Galactobacter sp.]
MNHENTPEPTGIKAFYKRHNAQFWTTIILAVYALYLIATFGAAWRLVITGELVGILMGILVVFIPLLGVWILIREIRYGATTQTMAHELLEQGLLPEDNLPRRPSGRIVREAADADFVQYKEEVEANEDRWQSWHRLALAYDACGDRRRARDCMKRAIQLRKAERARGEQVA